MATQAGHETRDPVETEYFVWSPAPDPESSPVTIEVHPDVMDGIARDVNESPGFEIGGLLLGSVLPPAADKSTALIRIERYHRIPCAHLAGPEFILDAVDLAGLEKTASAILNGGEFAAVGLYRSQIRAGLQLEPSDSDLIGRYFHEPFDLVLLIKPEVAGQMSGQFVIHSEDAQMRPLGEAFPWRSGQGTTQNRGRSRDRARAFAPPTLRSRRLIPDFVPDIVEPSRSYTPSDPDSDPDSSRANWTRWWPLPASLLVAGLALWMLLGPSGKPDRPSAPHAAEGTALPRPLGLYASETGNTWRVSWNPNATALHEARSVQLFVREGDGQTRIELTPQDLALGTYEYKPLTNDVTFRLEVTENSGRTSAESFRFVREVPAPAAAPEPKTPAPAPTAKITPPRAIHKVPPTIPESIQARIRSTITIEVRVKVDARGRVVSATPLGKHSSGLESYLAGRAVEAAKSWRFEPARQDGKPTAGEQNIRFTFNN